MFGQLLSCGQRLAVAALALGIGIPDSAAAAGSPAAGSPVPPPEPYVLDYPAAERFCAPVTTFFEAVGRTFETVRGRRFTHQPNGGYGLAIVQQVEGKNLVHLGADVGWHRVGLPVYAVAAGVVRTSEGPPPPSSTPKARDPESREDPRPSSHAMAWGNVIVIEHHLPGGQYFTTVYGHLGSKRLVKRGDIVHAGQQIGSVGAQHRAINGGYKPHLHFGVREGRLAEHGCTLFMVRVGGKSAPIKLVDVSSDEIEIELPGAIPLRNLHVDDRLFPITVRDGKSFLSSGLLWHIANRPGFSVAGYGLSTEGWRDPVAFLREHGADLK